MSMVMDFVNIGGNMASQAIVDQRKDRHVAKSSHGKFSNVAVLEAYRLGRPNKGKGVPRIAERFASQDNWLTSDRKFN